MHKMIVLLLITLLVVPAWSQQPALSAREVDLEHRAEKLHPNQPISVVLNNNEEEYGNFIKTGDQTFTFYDIDLQTRVTVPFSQIHKIKKGYGGFNSFQGRHTDRSHGIIALAVAMSALGALIVAAAVAR
jgi:hypothetical protein